MPAFAFLRRGDGTRRAFDVTWPSLTRPSRTFALPMTPLTRIVAVSRAFRCFSGLMQALVQAFNSFDKDLCARQAQVSDTNIGHPQW